MLGSLSHVHFFSEYVFMAGFGKANVLIKFEVAWCSHCRNINGDPKYCAAPLAQDHAPFSSEYVLTMGFSKP